MAINFFDSLRSKGPEASVDYWTKDEARRENVKWHAYLFRELGKKIGKSINDRGGEGNSSMADDLLDFQVRVSELFEDRDVREMHPIEIVKDSMSTSGELEENNGLKTIIDILRGDPVVFKDRWREYTPEDWTEARDICDAFMLSDLRHGDDGVTLYSTDTPDIWIIRRGIADSEGRNHYSWYLTGSKGSFIRSALKDDLRNKISGILDQPLIDRLKNV